MIEQFTAGMAQVSQPAPGGHRDRQPSGERDDPVDRFEDHVSKAGERQSSKSNKDRDSKDASEKDVVEPGRPVETLPKVAIELSAALKGFANPSGAKASLARPAGDDADGKLKGFRDALRSADKAQQADVALAKLVEKIRQAGKIEKPDAAAVEIDDRQPLTASDELSLLLGLTGDVEAGSGRRGASTDAADTRPEDDEEGADTLAGTIDVKGGDAMPIAVDTRRGGDEPASDNSSPRGDVVRIDSANGRGRSVDIDVPALPGTQSQDSAKSSNTPKIETATVLEARRYLGFSTETNGAALAAAIKSDPTWSAALQSAQRSDLGTLANTVTEVNTLKLQMNPEHLGTMVAVLKLKGEELTVELRVNSVEAYHHLTVDHDDIVKSLQDQGFSIDKITVQLNATDRTDTGADRDLARQQGQPQRDGRAQGEGQGEQPGRDDLPSEQQRWATPGDLADGTPGDGSTDPRRPGNIYL